MSLEKYKITAYKNPVASLPNSPSDAGMSAQELKAAFDANANDEIKKAVNAIIEHIEEQDSANATAINNKVEKVAGKGLSANDYTAEDKSKVAEIDNKAEKTNVIEKDSTTAYTPTADTHPTNKKYVDEAINEKVKELGSGDMMQNVYDPQAKKTDVFAYAAPEAEHKIKTYTSYTQLGLTASDFAADDFLANAQKIYEKMPNYSELRMTCYGSNLATSVIKKINNDLNGTWGTSNSLVLCVKRTYNTYPAEINVMIDYTGSEKVYTCILNNYNNVFTVSAFAVTYTPSGYVAKTGGTMSGNLTIEKSQPIFYLKDTASGRQMVNYMYSGVAYVRNALDSNNRTTITLNPETADIDNLVRVSTTVSGKLTTYNLFGEHNKPTGTYTGNSAARTIDVGGAGNFLVIKNETQAIAFVTQYGALLFYCLGATYVATVPTVKWVTDEMVNFTDGKLNIASYATHQEEGYSTINSSYAEYTYYVI